MKEERKIVLSVARNLYDSNLCTVLGGVAMMQQDTLVRH